MTTYTKLYIKSKSKSFPILTDLLGHSPDLYISTAFLHMMVKKTLENINNIPISII